MGRHSPSPTPTSKPSVQQVLEGHGEEGGGGGGQRSRGFRVKNPQTRQNPLVFHAQDACTGTLTRPPPRMRRTHRWDY